MWLVDPPVLCRQHLLGEHVEMHMAASYIRSGRSLKPWSARGFMDPRQLNARHDKLAAELVRRGYRHNSPLLPVRTDERGTVDVAANLAELARRCAACWDRLQDE